MKLVTLITVLLLTTAVASAQRFDRSYLRERIEARIAKRLAQRDAMRYRAEQRRYVLRDRIGQRLRARKFLRQRCGTI